VEALNRLLLQSPGGCSLEQLQKSKALFGNKTILKNVRDLASLSSVVQDAGAVVLRPKTGLVESLTGVYVVDAVAYAMEHSPRPIKIQEVLQNLKKKFPNLKKIPSPRSISNLVTSQKRLNSKSAAGEFKCYKKLYARIFDRKFFERWL
jgi:hypothetical protein